MIIVPADNALHAYKPLHLAVKASQPHVSVSPDYNALKSGIHIAEQICI